MERKQISCSLPAMEGDEWPSAALSFCRNFQIPLPATLLRTTGLLGNWLKFLATSREQVTQWKRPWCWKGLGAGGEGDDRGWDGWMASPTQWTWVWVNSGSWWWKVKPGVLQFMGSQRVGQDWATHLNWNELNWVFGNKNQLKNLQFSKGAC